jgi:hypothetical protein
MNERKTRMNKLVAAAAILAGLVLAPGALAAPNSSKISVSFDPAKLGSSGTTTIHVNVATTSDAVAQINIFAPVGVAANLSAAAGTTIGSVDATAVAHDQGGLTLPLSGNVVADNPASHTADACSPGTNQAVWNMNLSVAGQTLVIPIYVNPTTGAAAAFGAYVMRICLPPWDVPVGAPGRAAFGAQLVDARLVLNSIFTSATTAGTGVWEMITTPWTPGKGTPNPAGTWEARGVVPLPVVLTIKATYNAKKNTWTLSGLLTEGGRPVPNFTIRISRGPSSKSLPKQSSATTSASGTWKATGKLSPKKTTFFQARASAQERDFTQAGCQSPATAVAPAGCTSATLPGWAVTSAVARVVKK